MKTMGNGNRKRNRKMKKWYLAVPFFSLFLLLTSCYNQGQQSPDAWDLTKQQIDSISFSTTHHYTQNYNFLVRAPRLPLADALPDMAFDSLYVVRGERVVVAEIATVPSDTIDSIWVKVARDQITQGWIRENELLRGVSPDDPISQFIDFFSDAHLLIFLAFCVVVGGAFALQHLMRRRAYIVHFNDIDSFYPTLLCVLISMSATIYASIQMFGAESWRHFYFHPSLNPFALPFHLGLFVASVWAVIIVAAAAVDDVRRVLPASEAILYLAGLGAVCAVDYVVFSVSTLYYIGYPLLATYVYYCLYSYLRVSRSAYRCGQCGARIPAKGTCPHCGAVNV